MLFNLWIICLSLPAVFGDLSFLVDQRTEEQASLQNSLGNNRLKRSPGHEHEHKPHCDDKCLINEMLTHIGMTFDKEHCHAFEHVHCEDRIVPNEQICSTEGRTYPNHCKFIQTICHYIIHHHPDRPLHNVTIQSYGPCNALTTPQTTTTPTTPPAPISPTTKVVLFTAQPTNQSVKVTTNPHPPTTTKSTPYLLGQVFCTHKNEFICGQTFNVLCGSNGKFYPNICELSKAQCDDYTLTQVDISKCSLNTAVFG